jgi:hypothetical protein
MRIASDETLGAWRAYLRGAHPVVTCGASITCAAVRPGFSHFLQH